jgi:hypothetical protein
MLQVIGRRCGSSLLLQPAHADHSPIDEQAFARATALMNEFSEEGSKSVFDLARRRVRDARWEMQRVHDTPSISDTH